MSTEVLQKPFGNLLRITNILVITEVVSVTVKDQGRGTQMVYRMALSLVTFTAKHRGTETGRTACFRHLLRTRLINSMMLWEVIRSLGPSGSSEGPWLVLLRKAVWYCPPLALAPISPRNHFLHIRSPALTSQTLHQS